MQKKGRLSVIRNPRRDHAVYLLMQAEPVQQMGTVRIKSNVCQKESAQVAATSDFTI